MKSVKLIAAVSLAAGIVWIGGLGYTMNSQFFQQPAPPPKTDPKEVNSKPVKQKDEYLVVGLGDSLTRGIGDGDGKGYVGYLMDHLRSKSKEKVQLSNLAISGLKSPGLEKQLKQPEIQRQVSEADAIVMTIGGNDLFAGGQVMNNLSSESVEQTRTAFLNRLGGIFKQIRTINPDATIFYVGLYNPFNDLSSGSMTSSIVRDWNYYTAKEAAKYKKTIVVPTFDLFEQNVNDYLYSDKFHPNSEGYKLIGERLSSLMMFSEEGKTK
ncbi:GDSL family lipase [Bacillus sp. FJAT-42376]|uniref:SGNH/GDSL hydrolase family protein n=1 Tax=Bacillus sp. FJAT-42376 TaxID=2014076 RepID=UPI000F4DF4DA|nr:SGNH/GDSL hydrolase family protein [Bacillus sp. FJAT-42376]AZB42167.1 GDSL family lipase [Bacillus sp. FJAT-42376]